MKIKTLVGFKERETLEVLDKSLRGTAYRTFLKMRLCDVLEREDADILSAADRNFLKTSHLDFVIGDRRTQQPAFAVEFDGPYHQLEPYVGRDIRKNRLCSAARLPLLRIGYAALESYEQLTVLEFMLQRFVAWQRERGPIEEWVAATLSDIPSDKLQRMAENGELGVSADPNFWFDLRHKFPGIQSIARRLLARFRLVTDYIPQAVVRQLRLDDRYLRCFVGMSGEHHADDGHLVKVVAYSVYQHDARVHRWVDGKPVHPDVPILCAGRVEYRMRWALPIAADYDAHEPPISYLERTGQMPIGFLDVPGIHPPDIAEWMAEYLALRQVEAWAVQNLPARTPPDPADPSKGAVALEESGPER